MGYRLDSVETQHFCESDGIFESKGQFFFLIKLFFPSSSRLNTEDIALAHR